MRIIKPRQRAKDVKDVKDVLQSVVSLAVVFVLSRFVSCCTCTSVRYGCADTVVLGAAAAVSLGGLVRHNTSTDALYPPLLMASLFGRFRIRHGFALNLFNVSYSSGCVGSVDFQNDLLALFHESSPFSQRLARCSQWLALPIVRVGGSRSGSGSGDGSVPCAVWLPILFASLSATAIKSCTVITCGHIITPRDVSSGAQRDHNATAVRA